MKGLIEKFKLSIENIIEIIVLFVCLLGLVIGYIYLANKDVTNVNYPCLVNSIKVDDKYSVSIVTPYEPDGVTVKKWKNTLKGVGAQYDVTIKNNTNEALYDWHLVLDLPEGSFIESCWDVTFEDAGNGKYVSHALDYNQEIEPKGARVLGFILYTPDDYEFLKVVVRGTTDYNYKSENLYIVLLCLSIVWLCAVLYLFVDHIRSLNYAKQQEHDRMLTLQSIQTFINFIDAKDPYTQGHSSRVAIYSRELARRMGMKAEELDNLYYIALMHDAGKISVPDAILNKNGPLTDEEREVIKRHTTVGGEMLKSFTAIPDIVKGALYHHERYDGKGYPTGLAGEDIPLYGRIICVADSFDAMSSNRCYRRHLENETIVFELKNNAGSQFDPKIVPFMLEMIEDGFTDEVRANDGVDDI